MRVLRQLSISKPSRFVSTLRLSIVKLSTPVASTPNQPPCRMEKARRLTLRQFFSAIVLFPEPGPPPKLPPRPPGGGAGAGVEAGAVVNADAAAGGGSFGPTVPFGPCGPRPPRPPPPP